MISKAYLLGGVAAAVLLAGFFAGCRKEEQAVVGVAQTAVTKAQTAASAAQAAATERDQQRAALAIIPLPTKSLYMGVHEPSGWQNPFLTVGAAWIDLRVSFADAAPSAQGQSSMLRPEGARRQELQIHPNDLAQALLALPAPAWRYGRVVAIAESPTASKKDQPQVRRNMESALQQLSDLGIVVEEWPAK